jgi:hypothetical protein
MNYVLLFSFFTPFTLAPTFLALHIFLLGVQKIQMKEESKHYEMLQVQQQGAER